MKNKEKKSKIYNVLIIIFIFCIIFTTMMLKGTTDLDEIWNYNFAKNIADGKIPYRDFNMVQTPVLFMICAIFLNLLGNELIVMRILAGILLTVIFYICYEILKKLLGKNIRNSCLLIVFVFLFMFNDIFAIDYNYGVLLIALILTLIELNKLEKNENILNFNFKYDFVIGLIAGVGILFKQTTGAIVAIACIGYKIFAIRKKEDIFEFLKIAEIRFFGVIIPCVIFCIYLILNHAFSDFFDYAILGMFTFSNSKSYTNLFSSVWYVKALSIIVPIAILIMFIRIFVGKRDNKILILFAYSISSFVVVYPIADKIHFMVGSLISIIGIVYLLKNIIDKIILKFTSKNYFKFKDKLKNKFKIIILVCVDVMLIWIIIAFLLYICKDVYYYISSDKMTANHFTYISNNSEMMEAILEVDEYITKKNDEGYEVYILDFTAAIYMIPLDKYNKNYDMFLKGNLGSKGEQGIIDNLETGNIIYLVRSDEYFNNWQTPYTVLQYVKENFNKLDDEVYIFNAYIKE